MSYFLCLALIICATTERLQELYDTGLFHLDLPRLVYVGMIALAAVLLLLRKVGIGSDFRFYAKALLCLAVALLLSSVASGTLDLSLKRGLMYVASAAAPLVYYIVISAATGLEAERVLALTRKLIVTTALVVIASAGFALIQAVYEVALHRVERRSFIFIDLVRVNSLFNDPNFFACFLACALALLWSTRVLFAGKLTRYLFPPALALGLAALALTGSRGGVLALAFAMLLCWFLVGFRVALGERVRRFVAGLVAALPALIFSSVVVPMYSLLQVAMEYDDETLSGTSRLLAWYAGYQLWLDHKLLGIGPGNFTLSDKGEYLLGTIETWRIGLFSELAGHSNFIEYLVEGGILAGISLLVCGYAVLRAAVVSMPVEGQADDLRPLRIAALGLGGLLFAFVLATALLSYYPNWYGIYAGLALAVADTLRRAPRLRGMPDG